MMKNAVLVVIVLSILTPIAAADDFKLPAPAPAPLTRPTVPDGEKLFYQPFRTVIPGTRIWTQWSVGGIWHYNTTQSVGDGAGMMVYAPAGVEKLGWLCSMDTGVQPEKDKDGKVIQDDLKEYKGLCLWIKGDGSDGTAVLSTNWDFSDHQFRVPLKDTNWHKVFIPWDKWSPKPITDYWWYLTYGIERKDCTKANWFIVDRVHLFKAEKTEEIKPTPDVDPPGMLPAPGVCFGEGKHVKDAGQAKGPQASDDRDRWRLNRSLLANRVRSAGLHQTRL